MDVIDQVRIVVYRFHEKGLEILLVNHDLENDPDIWKIPQEKARNRFGVADSNSSYEMIELDPIQDRKGRLIRTIAIEGDWHDIPSIKALVKYDIRLIKNKIKEAVPELEKGSFIAIKEALKKVMPNEYSALKELKDILWDRNILLNI